MIKSKIFKPAAFYYQRKSMGSSEILLQSIQITKRFGGLNALNKVSFYIKKGERVGLIGPNGSGKTTLFNIISKALSPTSGSIIFESKDITNLRPHKICKLGIARTFQIPKPFPKLTVFKNVLIGMLFVRGNNKDFDVNREIAEILDMVGLSKKSSTKAADLTLTEQRLLDLAKALSIKPKLLLLDEVTAGLNPVETGQVLNLLRKLNNELGITIFMIEHNLRTIKEMVSRVIVLNRGEKIAEGTPKEVTRDQKVITAYLGESYA